MKEKKAPATFFVIGSSANDALGIIRREYAEGHEIGNHTYTHPRWNEISRTQIDVELNVTERLLNSTLGVKRSCSARRTASTTSPKRRMKSRNCRSRNPWAT